MTPLDLEGVHGAMELLVEDLHARSAAAERRHQQMRLSTRHELALVFRVEAEARRLQQGLAAGMAHGERVAALAALVTAALEFDVECPDGGAVLSSEHGEARQMTRTVVAHLVGEFSFRFLAGSPAEVFYKEAQTVLDTIGPLHFDDWETLSSGEAA